MANKKVVISKINSVGSVRNFKTRNKIAGAPNQIDGRALEDNYCSEDNDSITTYVQLKNWSVELTKYIYPPYVDCEYVI